MEALVWVWELVEEEENVGKEREMVVAAIVEAVFYFLPLARRKD